MSDLNQNTLSQITNLIKTKKISSLEVTKFFIKNIEKAKKDLKGYNLEVVYRF